MSNKMKSKSNKAKDVEAKQPTMQFCKVHQNVVNAAINCMANSICKIMTIQEVSQIIQVLKESKKV